MMDPSLGDDINVLTDSRQSNACKLEEQNTNVLWENAESKNHSSETASKSSNPSYDTDTNVPEFFENIKKPKNELQAIERNLSPVLMTSPCRESLQTDISIDKEHIANVKDPYPLPSWRYLESDFYEENTNIKTGHEETMDSIHEEIIRIAGQPFQQIENQDDVCYGDVMQQQLNTHDHDNAFLIDQMSRDSAYIDSLYLNQRFEQESDFPTAHMGHRKTGATRRRVLSNRPSPYLSPKKKGERFSSTPVTRASSPIRTNQRELLSSPVHFPFASLHNEILNPNILKEVLEPVKQDSLPRFKTPNETVHLRPWEVPSSPVRMEFIDPKWLNQQASEEKQELLESCKGRDSSPGVLRSSNTDSVLIPFKKEDKIQIIKVEPIACDERASVCPQFTKKGIEENATPMLSNSGIRSLSITESRFFKPVVIKSLLIKYRIMRQAIGEENPLSSSLEAYNSLLDYQLPLPTEEAPWETDWYKENNDIMWKYSTALDLWIPVPKPNKLYTD
ncbi:hypothetical protein SJAG_04976 [Schizosaccharomyces japonicus yFS275]|uniref:Uncharacterized protein n=1 Tax=Schizosaccharomyces japonicus (strain yFS275 / FY16936) TaxID=402676 RepID=B6K897_SCHJY|nr:hypothetical protein SJAG_04976 [Schizosaccharomyces japonicus yFS275]EEB09751.1 hypothetical protein SJAG_04976 [Schizosaccharomyces japonicus yFS275]